MVYVVFFTALILLLLATWWDLRTREIPNWISVALMVVAVSAALLGIANVKLWMVLSGGLLGLVIGFALFRFAKFGGGDAKLIAALGTLLGPVGLLFMLFWMALAGGVLALISLVRRQGDYAYVPAIAAGYIAYLVYPGEVLTRLFGP